nr:hypothetical protein [Streptomyces sp. MA5143a]
MLDRHRQRAQHPEVLRLAHPHPKIRTVQIDSRMLKNQSQGLVLHEQLVGVERLDGQPRPPCIRLRVSAQLLYAMPELLQTCRPDQ